MTRILPLLLLLLLGCEGIPSAALMPDAASKTDPVASGTFAPTALSCSINIRCPEARAWGEPARATVKISNGCVGVLLNNTRQDATAYVMTANHCGNPAVGDTLDWSFTFNYQGATCENPRKDPAGVVVTGGAVVRTAEQGFNDFALLELLGEIPASAGAYLAGWSRRQAQPQRGILIGHPRQDLKKITFDEDPVAHYGEMYWRARFDRGTVEVGSSGSPLFNEQGLFVGHVRGFSSFDPSACSGEGADDNAAVVVFPKLYYNWTLGAAGERIADFLDPDGLGLVEIPALRY